MKPQKALRTSLIATLMIALFLAPLNSSEMVTDLKKINMSTHLKMNAHEPLKQNNRPEKNGLDANKTEKTQNHSESVKNDKKHSEEEKHNNHVYNYDWISSGKKWFANMLRFFVKIFVAISFFSVLLCGFMSILH